MLVDPRNATFLVLRPRVRAKCSTARRPRRQAPSRATVDPIQPMVTARENVWVVFVTKASRNNSTGTANQLATAVVNSRPIGSDRQRRYRPRDSARRLNVAGAGPGAAGGPRRRGAGGARRAEEW